MFQDVRRVIIPECEMHEGIYKVQVYLNWRCPVCGSPRGEVKNTLSYDGSRRMSVDGWVNPCGHLDVYHKVRKEAKINGLN